MADKNKYHCQEPDSVLKILIVYKKPYTIPPLDNGIFIPIQAGKAISDIDLHIQGDNELNGQPCDNISSKNEYYAELTAIYWAWKNLRKLYPDVKYVGLCHHRRFFALHENELFSEAIVKPESFLKDFRYNIQEITDILESGKIIVPKRLTCPYSIKTQFCDCHSNYDYIMLREVLQEHFPDYYDAFVNILEHNNKFSSKLIHIMKWEDFDEWCKFLFPVMNILENKIPYQSYKGKPYAKVFAYLAERLFYVWQVRNGKKQKFCAFYHCEGTLQSRRHVVLNFFRRMLIHVSEVICWNMLLLRDKLSLLSFRMLRNKISSLSFRK